jgi:stage II sporulation protein AA (anti-sigma F factor antagonist)
VRQRRENAHTQPAGRRFAWRAHERGSVTHIAFAGDLDTDVAHVLASALEASTTGRRLTIVLDLSEVSFLDSAGLRLLLDVRARVRRADGDVYICDPSPIASRVIAISGVAPYFDVIDPNDIGESLCGICDAEIATIARRCTACGSAV